MQHGAPRVAVHDTWPACLPKGGFRCAVPGAVLMQAQIEARIEAPDQPLGRCWAVHCHANLCMLASMPSGHAQQLCMSQGGTSPQWMSQGTLNRRGWCVMALRTHLRRQISQVLGQGQAGLQHGGGSLDVLLCHLHRPQIDHDLCAQAAVSSLLSPQPSSFLLAPALAGGHATEATWQTSW